ncbi:bifunctional 2-keto-4-hydroxyglutarate aldolase/2-keto-3-deoxy-6-phosphogluconate aldolase [Psychrobacillus soli]|uniref:Bifunctional 4-hydroxy-2-oxoglutarate aldolase/2-dehydro-3-deoxy-phosphogluconate aldolase n=1 Tax=Psychrobacillus soli TaxID=1543965 RepID=A0A544TLB5_9BACI|nr:bifunctional 2-keto-4-hydroxyglutarate aldolase/2-keto-3-deoxy-6-phosphogluconate aldolase [Psychrobacillus soli]TQR18261.1 bifunctional 4-hydroxy-2-oxoglutarate aldolase/2-dehydro-3-deoxy-phosphogluconate aldolase [Psychrobacillus soli]
MFPKYESIKEAVNERVVAVVRGSSFEEAIAISKAAIAGGIRAIEVTYTTPQVRKVFEALLDENAVIGAGTVLDSETARDAILNGAQFVVSPNFDEKIATLCNRYSVPYFPGCMTIAEMVRAVESGCDIIKLFPANQFEPSFIGSVNGPLPNVRVMPTGGISLKNASEWIDAGAVAVGIGSDLTKAYRNDGVSAVMELAKKYVELTGGDPK